MKKLCLAVVIILYLFRLWQTTGCKNYLASNFSVLNVKIAVEEQVSLDTGTNRQVSRFFHNKVTAGLFEVAKNYTSPAEPGKLLKILSPLGMLLVVSSLYGAFKKPSIGKTANIVIVLVSISIMVFSKNSKMSFYIFAVSIYAFSLRSIGIFESKLLKLLFIPLAVASFLYFSFSWQMTGICNEIFFN